MSLSVDMHLHWCTTCADAGVRGMKRTIAGIGAFLVMLVPGSAVAAAAPSDSAPPVLASIALSRSAVTVSGVQVVNVTVSVHLTDASGVDSYYDMGGLTLPFVQFS